MFNINITIKTKLILFTILTSIGFVIFLTLLFITINNLDELKNSQILVEKLKSNILMLRRNEKDYLLRKDIIYKNQFEQNIKILNENTTKLSYLLQEFKIYNLNIKKFIHIIENYQIKFYDLTDKEHFLDAHIINFNSGIHGDMRKFVHQSESLLNFLSQELEIIITLKINHLKNKYMFFASVLVFFMLLSIFIILRNITLSIANFQNGLMQFFEFLDNKNIDTKLLNEEGFDEIKILAKQINKHIIISKENIQKERKLLKSKDFFLRYMAHELKTPISKGKFLVEKLEINDKESLNNIFLDLDILINQFLESERINIRKLSYTKFDVETLILTSLSKLSIENEDIIKIKINENFKLYADFHYLTIALKNIIDNAIKYSNSYPIDIIVDKHKIFVINKSNKLQHNFEYYTKPFTQEIEVNDFQGHGLGLYIVDKILEKHNFTLKYNYKDGSNIFIINI